MNKYKLLNFMFVGAIGFSLNLAMYYPLTLLFKAHTRFLGQVFYLPPYIISAFLATTSNYYLNKRWTFGDMQDKSLSYLRYLGMSGITIWGDLLVLFLLVQYVHLAPELAAALAILGVFISRYWIATKMIWKVKKEGII